MTRSVMRPRRIGLALLATPMLLAGCGGGSSATPAGGESTRVISTSHATARSSDAQLLQLLQKDGAHLAKPRSTRLYLDFPSRQDAGAARTEIPATYTVEALGKDGASGNYVLRLTTTMVITLDSIGRREAALTTIAARNHGALDGWEAAPKP
jgi:Regulator of ribonuclease activity B